MKQRKPGCYIAAVLLAGLMLGGCGNPNAKANTAESVSASDSETVSESEEIVSAGAETENGFETETETEAAVPDARTSLSPKVLASHLKSKLMTFAMHHMIQIRL